MTTTPKQAMAKSCSNHWDCETTQACDYRDYQRHGYCISLCFSDNCNKAVNNARDRRGWTPLHLAASGNSVDVARLLLENSANVDSAGNEGVTALHLAALENSVGVARLLLRYSANVDKADFYGTTALHYAASRNSVGVARLLLAKSANVDSTNNDGRTALLFHLYGDWKGLTPLQVAEKEGKQEMVELLRKAIPKACLYHGDCATTQVKTFF